jgi:hypothetical protein
VPWGGRLARPPRRGGTRGKAIAADIHRINAAKNGFMMHFTVPLAEAVTEEELAGALRIQSWYYTNTSQYGSAEHDRKDLALERVRLSADRKSALVIVKDFGNGDGWVDRIYYIHLPDTKQLFGEAPVWKHLESYFTLRAIP